MKRSKRGIFTFRSPLDGSPSPLVLVATTLQADTAYNYCIPIPVGVHKVGLSLLLTPGKWNLKISKSSRVAEAPWESL